MNAECRPKQKKRTEKNSSKYKTFSQRIKTSFQAKQNKNKEKKNQE